MPAMPAGLAANGTDSGTNMCHAAPQAAWPDLPSSPCLTQRDKYTLTPGVPAGRFACQAPVGAALQGLLPALLGPPPGPLELAPLDRASGNPSRATLAPNKASCDPSPGCCRPPAIPPGPARGPKTTRCSSQDTSSSWELAGPQTCAWSARGFGSPEAGAPARSQGGRGDLPRAQLRTRKWTVGLRPLGAPGRGVGAPSSTWPRG